VEIKLADSEPEAPIARKIHFKLLTRAVHLFPVVVFGGSQDSIGRTIVVNASRKLAAGTLIVRSPEGAILDPDNLYHRVFLPVLAKAAFARFAFMIFACLRAATPPKRRLDCLRQRRDRAQLDPSYSRQVRPPDSWRQCMLC
jgi:hypothetical protein